MEDSAVRRLAGITARLPRPLDPVRSLKAKLSILILAAVAVTAGASYVAFLLDLKPELGLLAAIVVALAMVQLLARGMTSPLREMERAAAAMARGDYGQRVTASSRDEVGALARAFNAMAADLDELERQRKELIANVSHELRTPLAALRGNLENLIDGATRPDDRSFAVMLRQTERLGRLVGQLLDLSRLEAGQLPMKSEPVDVRSMLRRVAEEATLMDPGRKLEVEAPAGLVQRGDPERLHQVFANLIENALRHSPPGEPVVLRARHEPDLVTIEVEDRGPGIPPDQGERVFERFQRAEGDRSRRTGGAGLGLSIARWIIELHGGRIEVLANEPSGCRMSVRLPRSPESRE